MSNIIHGSCLCGGVRFEVRPPFIRANPRAASTACRHDAQPIHLRHARECRPPT
jgi:hypothetical protein